jgi:putative tricarboxylic transport membrane protein
VNFSAFDLQVMTLLGLVAYSMRKNDYPLGPAILGLVLGDLMEQNLRRSLIMSRTGAMIFFTRPLTATLIALSVLSILAPALLRLVRLRRAPS